MVENEIKIDSKMKTIITNDWLKEFPSFKKTRPCMLEKRVGPLEVSFGYSIRYGTKIVMSISYFNLSNPLHHLCATLQTRPASRRSRLTWVQHEEGKYKEAAQELREQCPIPIEGPVTLSQIIKAYKNYKFLQYDTDNRYFEDPALIAAWAGKKRLARECLDWGRPFYDHNCSKLSENKPTEEWYDWMLEKISDPEKLQQTVEEQLVFHKLTKIPYEELIIDIEG